MRIRVDIDAQVFCSPQNFDTADELQQKVRSKIVSALESVGNAAAVEINLVLV